MSVTGSSSQPLALIAAQSGRAVRRWDKDELCSKVWPEGALGDTGGRNGWGGGDTGGWRYWGKYINVNWYEGVDEKDLMLLQSWHSFLKSWTFLIHEKKHESDLHDVIRHIMLTALTLSQPVDDQHVGPDFSCPKNEPSWLQGPVQATPPSVMWNGSNIFFPTHLCDCRCSADFEKHNLISML